MTTDRVSYLDTSKQSDTTTFDNNLNSNFGATSNP